MQTNLDMVAVRREILELLNQQMEVLDSPLELSEGRLMECYNRQTRVQELREILQAAFERRGKPEMNSPEYAVVEMPPLETAAA
jgi:hypothetical protein